MTQDEIIEMAKKAGFPIFGTKVVANDPMQQMLADAVTKHYHDSAIQFAKLVAAKERNRAWTQEDWTEYEHSIAAAEREACAKLCDELGAKDDTFYAEFSRSEDCAEAIRARGET